MSRKKLEPYDLQDVTVLNAGSEGKCFARHEEKVLILDYAVPGDVVDLHIYSRRKKFNLAAIKRIVQPSSDRVDTFCEHFGTCGGCKWQQMSYAAQLRYKQQQVQDAFERIGKFPFPTIKNIIGADETKYYRNKLEYNFTNEKWIDNPAEKAAMTATELAGLGYHVPGRYDKVFDVNTCYLQDDLQNKIRNAIRDFAKEKEFVFFDLYKQEGFLRSVFFRSNLNGEWMVIIVFGRDEEEKRNELLDFIKNNFPQITSLNYVINPKLNDTIFDLEVKCYFGNDHLIENLYELKFKIGPKSFFQTNTKQTLKLYAKTLEFAGLSGNETVYDLYTGVGTIANFVAKKSKEVIGIENVEEAIRDAKINSQINGIQNTKFFAGDMKNMLTDDFISEHGKPDVVITDPPRAGMHEDVVLKLLEMKPSRIVYVSCNPGTQARDIALMQKVYDVKEVQPVDMFPHTHHVENITLLELKTVA